MSYMIGYTPKGASTVSIAQGPNARETLKLALLLQISDEEIRYIKAPWGGEIDPGEFRMRAEQEDKG